MNEQFIAYKISDLCILAMTLRADRLKDAQYALKEHDDAKSACSRFHIIQQQAIDGDRAVSKAVSSISHLRGRKTPHCLHEMIILRDQYRTVAKEASKTIASIKRSFKK